MDNLREQPEELELAAALAAVRVFIEQDDVRAEPAPLPSTWSCAARLEGTGRLSARVCRPLPADVRRTPWRAKFNFVPVFVLLALSLLCLERPASAQVQMQATAPPFAPPFDGASMPINGPVQPESRLVNIRIGLALGASSLNLELPDGAEIQDADSGESLAVLPAGSKCVFFPDAKNGVGFRRTVQSPDGERRRSRDSSIRCAGFLVKSVGADAVFGLNQKVYRGALLVRPSAAAGALNAINVVDLEEYLLSVVPSEMPSGWPLEALKAQVVAARSYAVANFGKHEADGYDLKSTIEDQVYAGVGAENQATNQAVAETAGLVLKQEGHVIPAFFHSTSGGYTEAAEHVWGKSIPYLKSVPDYDDKAPLFTWSQKLTIPILEEALRKGGHDIGGLLGIFVVSRSPTMRARNVMVVGSQQVKMLSGDDLRRLLNLPSTNFNVGSDPDSYIIAGRGFGHGLGLSQWGAKTLAENGYNAAQILTYYYKNVTVDSL